MLKTVSYISIVSSLILVTQAAAEAPVSQATEAEKTAEIQQAENVQAEAKAVENYLAAAPMFIRSASGVITLNPEPPRSSQQAFIEMQDYLISLLGKEKYLEKVNQKLPEDHPKVTDAVMSDTNGDVIARYKVAADIIQPMIKAAPKVQEVAQEEKQDQGTIVIEIHDEPATNEEVAAEEPVAEENTTVVTEENGVVTIESVPADSAVAINAEVEEELVETTFTGDQIKWIQPSASTISESLLTPEETAAVEITAEESSAIKATDAELEAVGLKEKTTAKTEEKTGYNPNWKYSAAMGPTFTNGNAGAVIMGRGSINGLAGTTVEGEAQLVLTQSPELMMQVDVFKGWQPEVFKNEKYQILNATKFNLGKMDIVVGDRTYRYLYTPEMEIGGDLKYAKKGKGSARLELKGHYAPISFGTSQKTTVTPLVPTQPFQSPGGVVREEMVGEFYTRVGGGAKFAGKLDAVAIDLVAALEAEFVGSYLNNFTGGAMDLEVQLGSSNIGEAKAVLNALGFGNRMYAGFKAKQDPYDRGLNFYGIIFGIDNEDHWDEENEEENKVVNVKE